ncbi:MAG: xanthine dehydrogenase family protein subunit M [Smithellaceae bacterium]|nr:xanthine dehydrogenase family protein subunit M [Smithellaceae bacterium]
MREVFLPATLAELWSLLDLHPRALLFAGGTDLFVKMRAGKTDAGALIGLERITSLKEIREEQNDILIGAGATHAELLRHRLISTHLLVLHRALAVLGSPPIRSMGTIGGNLCTASPAGDALPPLYVLRASVETASAAGTRLTPIKDFIAGPGQTRLGADEIVTAIRVQKPADFNIQHYEKVGQRKSMACAVASLAALIRLDPSGAVQTARLAWGSVGPTVVTDEGLDNFLVGQTLSRETLGAAAEKIRRAVSPIDDIRASADYRRQISGNLLYRLSASAPAGNDAWDETL